MSSIISSENYKLPIIPLRFKSTTQVYKSYMPWFKNGGVFIPTNKHYQLGQEVLLAIVLPDSPEKLRAAGVVGWVTPRLCTSHPKTGVGVEFSDESGVAIRARIESLLGDQLNSGAPTYTL